MGDFGIRVSPRFRECPLWGVSPRALRLWLFLAMKAQHPQQNLVLSDGQRVPVARGQWLTSTRKLRKELGAGSLRDIVADMAELKASGAVKLRQIPRSQSGNRGVLKLVTPPLPNLKADCVMATLVTVEGAALAVDPVTKLVTKEVQGKRKSREEAEWERAEQVLVAEGR